jgi:NADPH-dependent ferric siderophore reductase
VAPVTPRLTRVTLAGPELAGLAVDEPAASVRLLIPSPGATALVMPAWNGNEFRLPDGSRPAIRTLTPLRFDPTAHRLDVEIVVHEDGPLAAWAQAATSGTEAALSGTGRGYPIDPDAASFVLGGDESAIPAISQLLEVLPPDKPVRVLIEVAAAAARLDLPKHPGATVQWYDLAAGAPPGDTLVAAVTTADVPPGTKIWAAGEAAAMQRIRRHLLEERNLPRSDTWIRGYWKHGRTGGSDDD